VTRRRGAQSLYGDLLWGMLLLTMVPILWTLVHKSPLERAQVHPGRRARG
jgi:hypothetical protein